MAGSRRKRREKKNDKDSAFSNATWKDVWKEEVWGDMKHYEFIPLEKLQQIYNFLHVLIHLEKVLCFGFWVCLDMFLFLFSFLPIRVFFNVLRLFVFSFTGFYRISKSQVYDTILGFLFIITVLLLYYLFDTSLVYHWIRQQQAIRLYVLINILEIFDRLGCSFGQDIFDSLYTNINVVKNIKTKNILLHIGFAQLYCLVHSSVLFIEIIALNVALNSSNYTLLHLLVSTNVAELKTAVFKRFRPDNIFQLVCHDIVERFQTTVFLITIAIHNMNDMAWYIPLTWISQTVQLFSLIIAVEYIIDWIKHCFVTKFNNVSYECYPQFLAFLRYDALCNSPCANKVQIFGKYISQTKRIGFVPLPLACITTRLLYTILPDIFGLRGIATIIIFLIITCILRTIIRYFLLSHCMNRLPRILNQIERNPDKNINLGLAMRYEFTKLGNRIP